ncbi:uncharacterized protein [Pocillopora verrucosa]|uniref:uncharacterized protein n=1 Tax=Pocillopora verrucosa TaxID=203993 RepID=UPI003342549E
MPLVKKCLFRRALIPLLINLPSPHHHLSPVERRSNPAGSNGHESLQQLGQQQRTLRKTHRLEYIALLLNNRILPVMNITYSSQVRWDCQLFLHKK